jgi:glycosyltransferase involved in cell wall biosynthesis
MEAMACGLTVVATDTGAIHELLQDSRGFLIPCEYSFTDVWGNSDRCMANIEYATTVIEGLMRSDKPEYALPARAFMETKTWEKPAQMLSNKIEELTNVPQ